MFRGGAFGRWLGYNKVTRMVSPQLISCVSPEESETRREIHTYLCCVLPCYALCWYWTLSPRPSPGCDLSIWDLHKVSQNKPLFFITYQLRGFVLQNALTQNVYIQILWQRHNFFQLYCHKVGKNQRFSYAQR